MGNGIINMVVTSTEEIFVTSEDTVPILWLKNLRELGIVEKGINAAVNAVTWNNPTITLIENPECLIGAIKRIVHCLKQPFKQKLQKLEAKKIIGKTEEPTDCVHNLAIVHKKDRSLRLCLSPNTLNACTRREHYQIQRLFQIQFCNVILMPQHWLR